MTLKNTKYAIVFFLFLCLPAQKAMAKLKPENILVVYNQNSETSKQIASYYIKKRKVPSKNLLALSIPSKSEIYISRANYNKFIAEPVRARVLKFDTAENITCILLTYDIPYKLGRKTPTAKEAAAIRKLLDQAENIIKQLTPYLYQLDMLISKPKTNHKNISYNRNNILKYLRTKYNKAAAAIKQQPKGPEKKSSQRILNKIKDQSYPLAKELYNINTKIDHLTGRETNASVDSELSMVTQDNYNLYRWQPNRLQGPGFNRDITTKMVCRLDGPDPNKIFQLIDDCITVEKTRLTGKAYFDSRGLKHSKHKGSFGYMDSAIRQAARIAREKGFETIEETSEKLFSPNSCPDTALYCGWYSLKKYIPAFTFVPGSIGYHIASWEAIDLRDPNSSQWCPAMLKNGISATLGAVAEPYLSAFPDPDKFFAELFNGLTIVEAYYKTKPYNSWQLILIADPLYCPFAGNNP